MKVHLNFQKITLVWLFLFLLSLQSTLSITYYYCDDDDKSDINTDNVCGFSLLSTDSQIVPLSDFSNAELACKSKLVLFAIEGYCSEFKQNSGVCPPQPYLNCFNKALENRVCAYQSTSSSCTRSPCRQTMFNYCSACLFDYLFYTLGPCE